MSLELLKISGHVFKQFNAFLAERINNAEGVGEIFSFGKVQKMMGNLISGKCFFKIKGIAAQIMDAVGGYDDVKERVMYLIAHHHTYTDIDGKDLQILIEADFIVNLYEDGASPVAVKSAYEKIFVTESGKRVLKDCFGI